MEVGLLPRGQELEVFVSGSFGHRPVHRPRSPPRPLPRSPPCPPPSTPRHRSRHRSRHRPGSGDAAPGSAAARRECREFGGAPCDHISSPITSGVEWAVISDNGAFPGGSGRSVAAAGAVIRRRSLWSVVEVVTDGPVGRGVKITVRRARHMVYRFIRHSRSSRIVIRTARSPWNGPSPYGHRDMRSYRTMPRHDRDR